ncbi:C-C motif chemokine 28 isoform X1 [Bufo gargarizans]|uniref:C-C motif chemokine 28 isoform X1 n=1 Tax=Bufo gargarizans TaxID=30331 RepID=UPI001CF1882A|nr:C-C motif chemokine 28 isoform X1 [Bufo gargarizans]
MNMTAVRLAAALLCLLYASEAFSFSSTRCCTQLGENISKTFLKKVKSYEIQKRDGTCHLQAVLLHLKHRTLCISPKNKRVQQWIVTQHKKSSVTQEPTKKYTQEPTKKYTQEPTKKYTGRKKKRRGNSKNKKKKMKDRKKKRI